MPLQGHVCTVEMQGARRILGCGQVLYVLCTLRYKEGIQVLTNRILGAFTFRNGVYAEVEYDSSFTKTAWINGGRMLYRLTAHEEAV